MGNKFTLLIFWIMKIAGINLASKPKGKYNTIDNEQRHWINL